MKKLILLSLSLGFVFSVEAQVPVIPYINNFVYNAQVQINNLNDYSVLCSGPIYMHMATGTTDIRYYFDTVLSRSYKYRSYIPSHINDRISFTTQSIYCRKN